MFAFIGMIQIFYTMVIPDVELDTRMVGLKCLQQSMREFRRAVIEVELSEACCLPDKLNEPSP